MHSYTLTVTIFYKIKLILMQQYVEKWKSRFAFNLHNISAIDLGAPNFGTENPQSNTIWNVIKLVFDDNHLQAVI